MQRTVRRWLEQAAFAAVSLFIAFPSIAQDNFFGGKTIRIVVGFPPGSGFDAYSRAIARHMGKPLNIRVGPRQLIDLTTGDSIRSIV